MNQILADADPLHRESSSGHDGPIRVEATTNDAERLLASGRLVLSAGPQLDVTPDIQPSLRVGRADTHLARRVHQQARLPHCSIEDVILVLEVVQDLRPPNARVPFP